MGLRAVLLWGAGVGAVAAIVRKLKNDGTIDAALERIAFQVALATRASRRGVRLGRWTARRRAGVRADARGLRAPSTVDGAHAARRGASLVRGRAACSGEQRRG